MAQNDPAIKFLSSQPREKAISVLKSADIYLHSSYPGGGLSTSLLEAIYCGCSIIATPNEGADEIIGNVGKGILIKQFNKDVLAEKIQNLILNKEGSHDNTKVKDLIFKNFYWENTIEKYLDIFEVEVKD